MYLLNDEPSKTCTFSTMYVLNNVPTQQFTLFPYCETFSSHLTDTLAFLDFVNLILLIYFPRKSASERI